MSFRNLIAFLTFAVMAGQATAQAPTTLQVESRIVLLDVSVHDAKGHPVLDLRPEEFRITERGTPQTIRSFEPPTAHAMPSGLIVKSAADLAKIGSAPVTLILLDELNVPWADRTYEKTKVLEWLKKQPEVLTQPTALLAVTDKDLAVLHDYTQSRDEMQQTLTKHTGSVDWRGAPSRTGSVAQENMMSTLGALEQVAQATRGIPGRKNVIWVGDGFPSVSRGDVGNTLVDRVDEALRRLSGAMLASRMTLSVVGSGLQDPMAMKRIETDSDKDASDMSGDTGVTLANDSLQFSSLAPATGGKAYRGRNDLDAEIGETVQDGASFYTLSYRPTEASNDPKKYRRIVVTVTRPGLTVQTRDGYFPEPKPAGPPTPTTQQLAFDLFGAAMSALPYTDLHVSVEKQKSGEYILHAAARDIAWADKADGTRHADLVLLAVCLSRNGKMLSKTFATLGSNTGSSITEIAGAKTTLPMSVTAPIGTTRIRFVVRDMGSGRVGTADYTP